MASIESSLRIFLASPNDVIQERNAFFRVTEELRTHVAKNLNFSLDLVRWDDLRPGIGADGQAVVNSQIGPFDLFIGIFWNRFGTPTSRADSGTREEFDLALKRWKAKKDVEIWIYFSQKPFNFTSREELEQKNKVIEFREELRSMGMYREYQDPNDFENRVRRDLLSLITERAHVDRYPIRGSSPAGEPRYIAESSSIPEGWISVRSGKLPHNSQLYALWINGESMFEADINNGDLAILNPQDDVENGDIVSIWLKDKETTTIKQFDGRRKNQVYLRPANVEEKIIRTRLDNIAIQGKVIAVIPNSAINNGLAEWVVFPKRPRLPEI